MASAGEHGLGGPVDGLWVNEYGSKLSLHTAGGDLLTGVYSSTTGSTGKYVVQGNQASRCGETGGRALALAIGWRSFAKGAADPSWHWSSGLSGQFTVENGVSKLVLMHAMAASAAFPGVAATGVYTDKLIYTRRSHDPMVSGVAAVDEAPIVCAENPLTGEWRSGDGTVLWMQVDHIGAAQLGRVSGQMVTRDGARSLVGVTDIHAVAAGLDYQSVALTVTQESGQSATALVGLLDLGHQDRLGLLAVCSRPTAPEATYIQSQIDAQVFTRF